MQQLIELIVIIAPKSQEEKAKELLSKKGVDLQFMCAGKGTAGSALADYFDLGDADKRVFFALAKRENYLEILSTIDSNLNVGKNKSIIFSLPLKSAMYSVVEQVGLASKVKRSTLSTKIKKLGQQIKEKKVAKKEFKKEIK